MSPTHFLRVVAILDIESRQRVERVECAKVKGKSKVWCRKGGGGGGREFNSPFSELLLQASVSNLCFIARLSARAVAEFFKPRSAGSNKSRGLYLSM